MGKKLLWMFLFLLPLCVQAQDSLTVDNGQVEEAQNVLPKPKFGYLSYSEVIKLMPEYVRAQEKLNLLQQRYDEELARADNEFNLKFSEFLEGQKNFPENILLKRQKELQDLMEKSIKFKSEMKTLLAQARKDFCAPVEEKLNAVIADVALQLQLEYVLNTDNNSYPYISKDSGLNITEFVKNHFEK
ncbi:MAG: OmpH family outer membrane protein [Bacteroidaceae bacterium]|nr:OmpH family outer membrane protein [Bacteroidaceae bacterium]MBR3896687.1 OmpH family outer membrane protein [Bacteroidaceae bacterium]